MNEERGQGHNVMNINKFRNYESCGSNRGIENVLAIPLRVNSINFTCDSRILAR